MFLFVKACPMLIARAHMQQLEQCQQLQQQSSSQRVGALSLIPFCLGISGHPSGSRQGHPRYTGGPISGKAVGGPNHSLAQQYSAETRQTVFFGDLPTNRERREGETKLNKFNIFFKFNFFLFPLLLSPLSPLASFCCKYNNSNDVFSRCKKCA